MYIYIYIYILTHTYPLVMIRLSARQDESGGTSKEVKMSLYLSMRSISEISSCFLGRRPCTLKSDIVSIKTTTMNLFGFEILKLKIRRLKLWKPTVVVPSVSAVFHVMFCRFTVLPFWHHAGFILRLRPISLLTLWIFRGFDSSIILI